MYVSRVRRLCVPKVSFCHRTGEYLGFHFHYFKYFCIIDKKISCGVNPTFLQQFRLFLVRRQVKYPVKFVRNSIQAEHMYAIPSLIMYTKTLRDPNIFQSCSLSVSGTKWLKLRTWKTQRLKFARFLFLRYHRKSVTQKCCMKIMGHAAHRKQCSNKVQKVKYSFGVPRKISKISEIFHGLSSFRKW